MTKQKSRSPEHVEKYEVQNNVFAATNEEFKKACSASGAAPTATQASKYRRKKGLAYGYKTYLKSHENDTVGDFLIYSAIEGEQ